MKVLNLLNIDEKFLNTVFLLDTRDFYLLSEIKKVLFLVRR